MGLGTTNSENRSATSSAGLSTAEDDVEGDREGSGCSLPLEGLGLRAWGNQGQGPSSDTQAPNCLNCFLLLEHRWRNQFLLKK